MIMYCDSVLCILNKSLFDDFPKVLKSKIDYLSFRFEGPLSESLQYFKLAEILLIPLMG